MGFKKPLEIKLQLTEECNFDCGFCFNKQSVSSSKKSLSENNAKKIVSKTAEEGIGGIRFTGGEPMLHPGLPKLLLQAKQLGLKTTLNTNASLINPKNVGEIAKHADILLVSLHSLPLNKNAQNSLALLSNFDLRAATILTKENIQNLEKFHEVISQNQFSQWVLLRQIPNQLNKSPVSSEDMQLAVQKIRQFNSSLAKKDWHLIENALPFCCSNPKQVEEIALGGIYEDGHSSLFVDTSSKIKPSYFLEVPLGNALTGSFHEAWNSPFMKRMNALEFIPEPCHNCNYVLKCMAGSRFSALFTSNSLYAFDPLALPSKFMPELKRNQ